MSCSYGNPDCHEPRHRTSSAAQVRVRDTVNSTLRGQVLTVVKTEQKRRMGAWTTSYLCEMPGYKYPGWFRDEEVEKP